MGETKKKQHGDIEQVVMIDGREAVTVSGAIRILKEVTNNGYSRDTILRMFYDGKIQGKRTPSANFYYVDSLREYRPAEKTGGRKPGATTTSITTREMALALIASGEMNQTEAARKFGVSRQTIKNWIEKAKKGIDK